MSGPVVPPNTFSNIFNNDNFNGEFLTLSEALALFYTQTQINALLAKYLPLAGGTMTGTLTSQNLVPAGTYTTPTGVYNLGTAAAPYANVYSNTFKLDGTTSGTVTIQPQPAAGNWFFNLPVAAAAAAGYYLTSDNGLTGGTGMTWTNPATGLVKSVAGTPNQIAVSASTGDPVTFSFPTTGLSLGSYSGTIPPSGGLIVPGQTGLGTNSVNASTQLQIASTNAYNTLLTGIQTGITASSTVCHFKQPTLSPPTSNTLTICDWANPTLTTATGQTTANAMGYYAQPTIGVGNLGTISTLADYWAAATVSANAGTIGTFYGYFFDGGSAGAGTINNVYGAKFNIPNFGSNRCALAADSLRIGSAPSGTDVTGNANIAGNCTAAVYNLAGSSSGVVTVQPGAAVAGTYNFNLPTTAGTSGYYLTSAGGGSSAMIWTNPAATTPVSSHTATTGFGTLTGGTAKQNTLGYDIYLNITVNLTGATAAVVNLGVGSTSTPTVDALTPALSVTGDVSFGAIVPNNYYVLVTATGTLATIGSITVQACGM